MLFEKLLLGVSLAAPIGPVNIEMIRRGLNAGFIQAFVVRVGGCLGQTLFLLAAYFSLAPLMKNPLFSNLAGFLGSAFLIYLGFTSLKKRLKTLDRGDANQQYRFANGLGVGLVLALANPISIVFWLGIFAASMSQSELPSSHWLGISQNLLIILGVLLWGLFFSVLLEGGRRVLSAKLITVISILSGLCLIGYGLYYGYGSFGRLIEFL